MIKAEPTHKNITKALKQIGKEAAQRAIDEAFALGIPVTYQIDNKVVKVYPDGKQEVLEELPEAFVKVTQKTFKLK